MRGFFGGGGVDDDWEEDLLMDSGFWNMELVAGDGDGAGAGDGGDLCRRK